MPDDTQNDPAPSRNPIKRFLNARNDSVAKTVTVAVGVCLIASLLVSSLAVSLREQQEINKLQDKQKNILEVAGRYEEGIDIAAAFREFEPKVVDLSTGQFTDRFDPATFDDRAAKDDPELSRALTYDPAGLGRQANYAVVYLLRDEEGGLDKVILPISGYGLWSTLYGFIAIEEDGNEIYGLQYYEHGETPGLGAEVDNSRWKGLWRGKYIEDQDGELQISVGKNPGSAGEDYHVDGLAGATLTSDGVSNMIQYWLGENGFEPFLDNLRAGDIA